MNQPNAYTEEQVRSGAQVLANELLKQHEHVLALQILMVAYMAIAKANPCSTQISANMAVKSGMKLAMLAQGRPANAPVH